MDSVIKNHIIKALNKIIERNELIGRLYGMGVNLMELDNTYTTLTEDSIAFLICGDNLEFYKAIREDIGWWLYDDVEKIITLKDESKVDVTEAETFVDWIIEHYKI